ncbi:MAG: hypothetical protein IPM23_01010 [Candidatus Melainabacteria bacterium]|nr:hypothetical protein [Candidatus Melainabacteria bacterium]
MRNVTNSPDELKLGSLLSHFGVVSEQDVRRGLVLSKHTGLPLGKCLVMLDITVPEVVRAAIEAQSMLKDSLIDLESATEAMGVVQRKKWTLPDALIVLGVDAYASRGTRLGELLASSQHLTAEQLDIALRASDTSGLPLGRVLILLDKLNASSLSLALELQHDVRAGRVERGHAVDRLKQEKPEPGGSVSAEDAKKIKVGELLVSASVLSEAEVLSAVQMAKANDKMVGEVLIEMGWLTEELLTVSLRLQEMIWSGGVSAKRASRSLRQICNSGLNPDESLKELGLAPSSLQKDLTYCDFLRLSGYLSRDAMKNIIRDIMSSPEMVALVMRHARSSGEMSSNYLKEAIKLSFRDSELLARLIKEVRPKDAYLMDSGLIMHELLKNGKLTLDQALINFTIRRNGLEVK